MLFEKRSIGQKRLRSTALVPDNKASSIVFSSCAKHHVPKFEAQWITGWTRNQLM